LPSQDRGNQSAAGKGQKSSAHRVTIQEARQMALTRGSFGSYEFDRMVVLFSMVDGPTEIPCAVSTSAMDDLEKSERVKPDQREAQFMRLRDRIEERAACKFLAREFEGTPPGIILRSLDFRK
jgi:Protein of unknown function (DUF1488)